MKSIIKEIAIHSIHKIVIENEIWDPDLQEDKYTYFREKQGAFTTLYTGTAQNKNLRGCIGVPNPIYPLGKAISYSARSAAVSDPRFPPVQITELGELLFSVEILSPIVEINFENSKDLATKVELGEDGLIIQHFTHRGLLLPRVPMEYNWDVHTFLRHLCIKASLPPSVLDNPETKIFKFKSTLFKYY